VLPWDKHVSAGIEIELDQLSQKFRRGIVELAAALSDDFDTGEHHPRHDSST
jgi:MinD-like ATPase involved in chromosome partitioning or flagellar assembly